MSVSGFDDSEILYGRPYGGCAIIYKQELAGEIKQINSLSRRFCAIELQAEDQLYLIINVYMPRDYRNPHSAQLLRDTLGELSGFISTHAHDHLLIIGDWNTDFSRSCNFTDIVLSFMGDLSLLAIDLNFEDEIGFTYYRDSDDHKSWIDHILARQCTRHLISRIHSLPSGSNLSDHIPLVTELKLRLAILPLMMFLAWINIDELHGIKQPWNRRYYTSRM